ncbi:MAG TPA: hypothetical protein VMP01_00595 [Pirellulaceae bacterium]|nr:hypothetical protein [Pirellulaceae bacterium]
MLGSSVAQSQDEPTGLPTRAPVPTGAALEKARKTVEEVFGEGIRDAKDADAAKLADELISVGLKESDDAANRYALYDAARLLAEKGGSVDLAWRACDQIADAYEVDRVSLKESAFVACAKMVRRPVEIPPLVAAGLQLVEEAIAADQYAVAVRAADIARDRARRTRQRDLIAKAADGAKRAEVLSAAWAAVRSDFDRLAREPEHAASHTAVGRYLCLSKGDWEQGLPHLAKGDDETLRALAAMENPLPEKADERLALGDAWLERAKGAKESERPQVEGRAAYWYRLAVPALAGFERARVEKALQSLPAEKQAPAKTPADSWKSVVGTWKVTYENGAVRTYRFDRRGSARFFEESFTGTLSRDGDHLKLDFGDGKLERLRLQDDELLVEHFNPASGYPSSPSLKGRGVRTAR